MRGPHFPQFKKFSDFFLSRHYFIPFYSHIKNNMALFHWIVKVFSECRSFVARQFDLPAQGSGRIRDCVTKHTGEGGSQPKCHFLHLLKDSFELLIILYFGKNVTSLSRWRWWNSMPASPNVTWGAKICQINVTNCLNGLWNSLAFTCNRHKNCFISDLVDSPESFSNFLLWCTFGVRVGTRGPQPHDLHHPRCPWSAWSGEEFPPCRCSFEMKLKHEKWITT